MKRTLIQSIGIIALYLTGCNQEHETVSGRLYIIGGGSRPVTMLNELADLSGIRSAGYMYVLPMASSEPDSAILRAKEDFKPTGIKSISGYNFRSGVVPPQAQLDSLKNAGLIYISGGDQSRFMAVVLNTPVMEAVLQAYQNGSVIAGTSAGAAVMSKKMITGNQKMHLSPDAGFTTIEADNIEITQGLGLLKDVILDQHFIKRQRLNRLVAAAVENPEQLCVGIDESTAIIVEGDIATVSGNGQVIVIKNMGKGSIVRNGLLGSGGLQLCVYLPGQKFNLR